MLFVPSFCCVLWGNRRFEARRRVADFFPFADSVSRREGEGVGSSTVKERKYDGATTRLLLDFQGITKIERFHGDTKWANVQEDYRAGKCPTIALHECGQT
jgi:hypothetical protein